MKLVLIRGIPGSGKSTLAKDEYVSKGYKHFEADMYFYDNSGVYKFDHNLIKEAHKWCQNSVSETMSRGQPVVVSNTFVKNWEMSFYKDLAIKHNYEVEVIICRGQYKNIHNVPDEIVTRMESSFEL